MTTDDLFPAVETPPTALERARRRLFKAEENLQASIHATDEHGDFEDDEAVTELRNAETDLTALESAEIERRRG